MVEKKKETQSKRMEKYGFKGVMLYLREEEYEALRRYCYEKRLKHSPVIRGALATLLKKESYLAKDAEV